MTKKILRGIVIRSQSGFFTLDTAEGEVVARLRGRLKQGPKTGDLIAVGDWVKVAILDEDTAMIEEIEERERKLHRLAPTPRGEYEQIIIANPDQAILTFACANPEPRLRMLDRFLIIAEEQGIPPVIVFNKTDLIGGRLARNLYGHYAKLGYRVLFTSVEHKRGIRKLGKLLTGKISVFVGPSGVGKSSLLNAVDPDLGLHVREVSEATGKGRHTTVVREMFPLKNGGYVADTPGLKALALWDIEPEELDGYFPEIAERVADCQFSSCTHVDEPGCAVVKAVEKGKIHPERYESYLRIRFEDEW
ncbi:MAG: ribosome small subunit-dependent GTPase A [Anaerolineales bacterium]|nr:ribosome small subunit-dependent GTPase A [Anaerolineales bacterium]